MAIPVTTAKVAFADGWADPGPTFNSITAPVEGVTVSVGRQQETNQFQSGTCSTKFFDSARELDPANAASAHSPNVKPNKRIQLLTTISGTPYNLYDGYVSEWPFDYDSPAEAHVNVSAADVFKQLSRTNLIDCPYVMLAKPSVSLADHWFRLGETAGTTLANEVDPTLPGSPSIDLSRMSGSGLAFGTSLGGLSSTIVYPGLQWATFPAVCGVVGTGWSFGFLIQREVQANVTDSFGVWKQVVGTGSATSFSIYVTGTYVGITWTNGNTCSAPIANDGRTHTVYISNSGTGSTQTIIYIDGIDVGTVFAGGAGAAVPTPDSIVMNEIFGYSTPPTFKVTISDVLIWQSLAISAGTVSILDTEARNPRVGDTTGRRIEYILRLVGFDMTRTNIDTGTAVLGAASWSSTDALSYMQLCSDTEQGELFYDHTQNMLVFLDRDTLLGGGTLNRTATSQGTFSDDGTLADAAVWRYEKLTTSMPDQLIYNRVEVTWVGGTAVAEDTASQDEFGTQVLTITTLLNTGTEAQGVADFLLLKWSQPITRITGMQVNPMSYPALFVQLLTMQIGDRITIRYKPQRTGTTISQDFIVEGWTHTIDSIARTWMTDIKLRQVDAGGFWLLGVGQIGTTDVLGM